MVVTSKLEELYMDTKGRISLIAAQRKADGLGETNIRSLAAAAGVPEYTLYQMDDGADYINIPEVKKLAVFLKLETLAPLLGLPDPDSEVVIKENHLRVAAKEKETSLNKLSIGIGMRYKTLLALNNSQAKQVKLEQLVAICNILGVSIDYVLQYYLPDDEDGRDE